MGTLYRNVSQHIEELEPNTTIVEIGSDRGEGSTIYFAELAKKYSLEFHTVDILDNAKSQNNHLDINWHIAVGSTWCQETYPLIDKKISILYLDNFDYIWDVTYHGSTPDSMWNEEIYNNLRGESWPEQFTPYNQLPKWLQEEVVNDYDISYDLMLNEMKKQYAKFGFELSNTSCQLEHFKQLYYLIEYLADNCIVVFDDTFKINDCWTGKNGPGVSLLLTLGFNIVDQVDIKLNKGVILKRGN